MKTEIALLKERVENQGLRITEIKRECHEEMEKVRIEITLLRKERENFLVWGIIVLGIGIVGMGTYIWNRIHS